MSSQPKVLKRQQDRLQPDHYRNFRPMASNWEQRRQLLQLLCVHPITSNLDQYSQLLRFLLGESPPYNQQVESVQPASAAPIGNLLVYPTPPILAERRSLFVLSSLCYTSNLCHLSPSSWL
ncbi:uncharacterized protein LOC141895562 isoform X2 [Acropora palmata]|uniref:uncharacterized protein LOC141895562 isoform X2 n=1 Tax=Acropora palmata TaxID=6131 RepID=UPI003DA17DE0